MSSAPPPHPQPSAPRAFQELVTEVIRSRLVARGAAGLTGEELDAAVREELRQLTETAEARAEAQTSVRLARGAPGPRRGAAGVPRRGEDGR